MGGSGGSSYSNYNVSVAKQVAEIQLQESERLLTDINEMIQELLLEFNARDAELTNERLDDLAKILGDSVELSTILLGGSVAKSTSVEGISDLDALFIIDHKDALSENPSTFRHEFYNMLYDNLSRAGVQSIKEGQLAVTVTYKDGMEIQLLPAYRHRGKIMIDSGNGKNWVATDPKIFKEKLTAANNKVNGALVPSIKLLKSIISSLPRPKQLSGYHIESLAIDAVSDYPSDKGKVTREVLMHVISKASDRVMRPIKDVTGQSKNVDEYLGSAGSVERRNVSQALSGIYRRLEAATSREEWRRVLNA